MLEAAHKNSFLRGSAVGFGLKKPPFHITHP